MLYIRHHRLAVQRQLRWAEMMALARYLRAMVGAGTAPSVAFMEGTAEFMGVMMGAGAMVVRLRSRPSTSCQTPLLALLAMKTGPSMVGLQV